MRRRSFLAGMGGAAALWPDTAPAQPARMLRVGAVLPLPRTVPFWLAFEQKLAALGWREGQNVVIDYVQPSGFEAFDAACREIVARKADVLVAAGPEQSLTSARAATSTLPIVMVAVDYDPIARGYVANLARPTGNVTGVYFQSTELAARRLQVLKEIVPGLTAMAVFWDRAAIDGWVAVQAAAPRFGIRLTGIEFRERPYDYERALAAVAPADRAAVLASGSPFFFQDRAILAQVALRLRTPAMLNSRDAVVAGGLVSYAPSFIGMFELAATYVDRIGRGAAPADLPVQQPTRFELALNLKTAKVLGLTVPPSAIAQADEVIE